MTKAELDTKRADLAQTRERLRELAEKFPQADAAVRAAADTVERAKLAADLRLGDRGASEQAEHEARQLDQAILDRDAISESIERLRRHESALAAELAAHREVGVAEAQAAARKAIPERIKADAAQARAWAGLVVLDSELRGRQIADLGLLLLEYMEGEFKPSGQFGTERAKQLLHAEAQRLRDRFERGEEVVR